MVRRRFHLGIGLGCLGLLSACADGTPAPTVETTGMPNAELALQRSMEHVDVDLGHLGSMNVTQASAQGIAPAELQQPMNWGWSGPIDKGAQALADRIGYRFVAIKPKNPQPIVVTVTRTDATVLEMFEALGASAGSRAMVTVDPYHHLVRVDHHV